MGIYRGPGGTGDAINDASSEATLVSQLVTQAQESEANASTSATAAANSASAASSSASAAATAKTNAETAEANAETAEANAETAQAAAEAAQAAAEAAQLAAETAETNAETAETNAETAQSAAATSATNAASSASTATTQATNASNSASAAATSATNASNSASAAATSATNAASSATSASGSATTATTQASNASTSATNAATSETNAASSATTATTQAGVATTQASNAATSATNAASSASAASTSASNAASSATAAANAQSAAETARDQTLAAFDSFDDRYLGQKSTAPTVDNDGDALVAGALYFNTTTNEMKVYDGSIWLNAYASLSGALLATNNLSDLNNAVTARDNLGVEIGVDVQAYDAQLADIAGLTPTDNGVIIGNGTNFVVESGATLKTSLGLTIGTDVQAWDADLDTWATKTAPSGTVVGTSDTQTLTNKTLALGSNTVSGTLAQFNTAVTDADFASLAGTETLTNKTLTNPTINGFTGDTSVVNLGSGQFYKDASGNIGIGTSSPATRFQIESSASNTRAKVVSALSGSSYYSGIEFSRTSTLGGALIETARNATYGGVGLAFSTTADNAAEVAGTYTERMRIDSSGNVGIGVVPSAWAIGRSLSVGKAGAFYGDGIDVGWKTGLAANAYRTATSTWKYQNTGIAATLFESDSGVFTWQSAASGTAGNDITFSERMRIDSAGNVCVGTTTALVNATNRGNITINGVSSSILALGVNGTTKGYVYTDTNHLELDSQAGYLSCNTGGYERMRIDSSGRVGVGVTPASSDGIFNISINGVNLHLGYGTNFDNYFTAGASGIQVFRNAGTERMRIDSSGNVCIGTTTGVQPLTIGGTGNIYASSGATWYTGGDLYVRAGSGGFLSFGANNTNDLMRLSSSGNVGIGVAPSAWSGYRALQVGSTMSLWSSTSGNSSAFYSQNLYFNGSNRIALTTGTAVEYIQDLNGNHIWFNAPSVSAGSVLTMTERMRIDSSGNLLVGTTSASALQNNNSFVVRAVGDFIQNHVNGTGSGAGYAFFGYNGGAIGSITQSGTTAVAYNTSSDYRLKENIAPMTGALDVVQQLKPVTYNWKADGSSGQGFIAHELQAVVPDCVTGEKDAVDEEGNPQYQGIDTSFLVATLTKAIQELKAELDVVKAELNTLKGN